MTTALHTPTTLNGDAGRTCPDWCDPQLCDGGDIYQVGGAVIVMSRIHSAVLYDATATSADYLTEVVPVRVLRRQEQDDTGLYPASVILAVGSVRITVPPDIAAGLVAALTT